MEENTVASRGSHSVALVILLFVLDSLSIVFALFFAAIMTLSTETGATFAAHLWRHCLYLPIFLLVWPLAGANNRLFISRRRDDLLSLVFDISKSVAISLVFTGFGIAFYSPLGAEHTFLTYFGLSVLTGLCALRVALQLFLWSVRSRGINERQVLIIGANERTRHLVNIITENAHYGYHIMGILDDDIERSRLVKEFKIKHLGTFDDLQRVLKENVIDEVYVCLPVRSRYETIQRIAYICEEVGVSVRMVADLFPLRLATSRFHKLEDIPILALSTVPENQPQLVLQRITDILGSSVLLTLLSPVFLLTALAIKVDSKGPVFFSQERVCLNHRRFKMIKFRSMVPNAEALRKDVERLNEAEGPIFKATNDPRLTRMGRFIRKYSIDELPQLINVFKGDMSLVGPRPPLPSEVDQYTWNQRRRLSVKPGMTGLSQVSGRSELSFEDTVYLDLYYIDQWSLALVFRILLLTIPAVLRGRGAM